MVRFVDALDNDEQLARHEYASKSEGKSHSATLTDILSYQTRQFSILNKIYMRS